MKKIIFILLILYSTIIFAEEGFLSEDDLPNSFLILAPFPDMDPIPGSEDIFYPNFAEDKVITEALFREGEFLNGQIVPLDRQEEAKLDADTSEDYYIKIFVNSLNIMNKQKVIDELKRSHIIAKVTTDAKKSTEIGKDTFQRERPYAYYDTTSCTGNTKVSDPDKATHSYPSAHSTRGMVVAHVLADMLDDPNDKSHAIREKVLSRGMRYGDNRIICGAHWRSDIEAGRILASAVYEKLNNNEEFKKEFAEIQKNIGVK